MLIRLVSTGSFGQNPNPELEPQSPLGPRSGEPRVLRRRGEHIVPRAGALLCIEGFAFWLTGLKSWDLVCFGNGKGFDCSACEAQDKHFACFAS